MSYPSIDRNQIRVFPLAMRKSKSRVENIMLDPDSKPPAIPDAAERALDTLVQRLVAARKKNAAVMMAFGAHLVKNGAAPVVIKLMETGWLTHLATQGAGGIHDWELAFCGRTEEDVRTNVATGSFGTWDETGAYINLAVLVGATQSMGYGESLGALIHNESLNIPGRQQLLAEIKSSIEGKIDRLPALSELLSTLTKLSLQPGVHSVKHPFKSGSIAGNAYRLRIPLTIHPGIGYDIIYNHPLSNGAALGRGAHLDFETYIHTLLNLQGGVFLSTGSAIMAPQVFEKALSCANNLRIHRYGKTALRDFYILVNDLQTSVWDWQKGEPPKRSPDYYLRFLKSFYRMGGTVDYLALDNRSLLHNLYYRLLRV